LWDELRTAQEIEDEISRQARTSAELLMLPPAQVFPVSAQKALLAKVNGDDVLLAKSRLPQLETALSRELIPAKRRIVGSATQTEIRALVAGTRTILDSRIAGIREQLGELQNLRGKNQDVVEHMMDRIQQEKNLFERGMQRYTALRTVFTQQTNSLYESIGLETLRATAADTRERIEKSPFTKGVRSAMGDFFAKIYGSLDASARQTAETHEMMHAMYQRFAKEHGIEPFTPPPFSMLKYQKEVERLERAYNVHFNTLWNMVSKAKFTLMKRFFETIAIRVKHVFDIATRDLESWLKAVMAPLETQVREHHLQLRRRLESVKRIHRASDELEERIAELEQAEVAAKAQIAALARELATIDAICEQAEPLPLAANG
jgi:DNA repair exonuclease SbcCD ATPase subunit